VFAQDAVGQVRQDSIRVAQLLDSAYELEGHDKKTALTLYNEIIRICDQSGYMLGKAKALHYTAIVYSDENRFEESLLHYRKAIQVYERIQNSRGIGSCYGNIGNVFLYQGKLDSAVVYYQIGIKIFEQHAIEDGLSTFYGNAGSVFQRLKQYDHAAAYFDKALNVAVAEQDSVTICRALTNKGALLFDLMRYDESIRVLKRSLSIAEKVDDDYSIQNNNINLAECYQSKGLYREAIAYGLKALDYAMHVGTPFDIADIKKTVGDLYAAAGQLKEGERYYLQALTLAEDIRALEIEAGACYSLQALYARQQNYKEAYRFQGLAKQYQDSILSEKQLKTINELEVRYQTERKDKELAQYDLRLQKGEKYVIYSVGTAVIAVFITWLIVVYYRNKRKMYIRELDSVRKEKEVQVLQALMEGEEKERARIASDLHDEVSGMVAATKLLLTALARTSPTLRLDNGYRKVIHLLDETAVRIRNTAHNLLPEVLMQNGLEGALQRFCQNISHDGSLAVSFYAIGNVPRYSPGFELAVYRIVQELLNNVMKHAMATSVLVQISAYETILSVSVEDNGTGFTNEHKSNGTGLKSLQARVKALNGTMDISSREGQGVSVYIEFQTTLHHLAVS
jgi:signal transduction histidine kinase